MTNHSTITGPPALFRRKRRMPFSVMLTERHHAELAHAAARLGLSRGDVIALLIDRYAETVTVPADLRHPRAADAR